MYYFVASIILIGIIIFVEFKRKRISYKLGASYSLMGSFKNNFSVIKFVSISLLFVSFIMIFIIKLERGGFISFNSKDFELVFLPNVLYTSFVIPVFEEYCFRFLPYSFKKFKSVYVYILVLIISSIIFAFFHDVDMFQRFIIFFIAIIFSIIYLKTHNIIYSIGCHSLYNIVTLFRLYTGYSNAGVFMLMFLFSLFMVIYINKRVKA